MTPTDAGRSDEPGAAARGADEAPGGREPSEPTARGTLFIMMLFLMALGAMWGLMYLILLNR